MSKKIFREERLRLITDLAYRQKKVVVRELADKFNRSSSSIRLDLEELESRGLLVRTHGGAILADDAESEFLLGKNFLTKRIDMNKPEKLKMADAVANLVHDGDSVMIDGGSTTYYVAKSLSTKRGLTVITTSLYLLPPLMENAETKIFMTGGMIHRDFQDLVGGTAVDCLAKFSPTCAITGIDGYSIEHGLTTTESSTAQIKKKMLSVSRRMIVVADSSKYGKSCLFHVANLQEVHALVTDIKVPEELRNFLENSGVELICV